MRVGVIRDPLWNNIRLDPVARRLVDAAAFQRLRYVRQLGLAHLVYPGATHTRFEHALGAYHLARRTLGLLGDRGELQRVSNDDCEIVRAAALLHDIGHYPFSHALEEIGATHHEEVARPLITEGEVARLLREAFGADAPGRIVDLIRGASSSPLQGLIAGSLDLDKIEYLKRDAFMCGVPYGEVDVDRLLDSLVLVDDPAAGRLTIGVHEKGLAALESLLFAKYQMYRNVYWHHAVRSATAMYKRLVSDAIGTGALDASTLAGFTDEGLLHRVEAAGDFPLLAALRARRLYKRAFECSASELPDHTGEWIADNRALASQVEDALARELGVGAGEVLLDYPTKAQMLGLDIAVLGRDGTVTRLTAGGIAGTINLPRLSEQLYRSARWLRIYTAAPVALPRGPALELLRLPVDGIRARLASGGPMLAG